MTFISQSDMPVSTEARRESPRPNPLHLLPAPLRRNRGYPFIPSDEAAHRAPNAPMEAFSRLSGNRVASGSLPRNNGRKSTSFTPRKPLFAAASLMNPKRSLEIYRQRVHRVMDFISEHLDEPLPLEKLARLRAFLAVPLPSHIPLRG